MFERLDRLVSSSERSGSFRSTVSLGASWMRFMGLSIAFWLPPCLDVEKVSDGYSDGFCPVRVVFLVHEFVQCLDVGFWKV